MSGQHIDTLIKDDETVKATSEQQMPQEEKVVPNNLSDYPCWSRPKVCLVQLLFPTVWSFPAFLINPLPSTLSSPAVDHFHAPSALGRCVLLPHHS